MKNGVFLQPDIYIKAAAMMIVLSMTTAAEFLGLIIMILTLHFYGAKII